MSKGKPAGAVNWPADEVKHLRELWAQGIDCRKIGETLTKEYGTHRSKSAVIGKANRLGLKPRKGGKARHTALPPIVTLGGHVRRCTWPVGDPRSQDFHFCGDGLWHANTPYCEEHTHRAYEIPPDPPAKALDGPKPPKGEAQWLG